MLPAVSRPDSLQGETPSLPQAETREQEPLAKDLGERQSQSSPLCNIFRTLRHASHIPSRPYRVQSERRRQTRTKKNDDLPNNKVQIP